MHGAWAPRRRVAPVPTLVRRPGVDAGVAPDLGPAAHMEGMTFHEHPQDGARRACNARLGIVPVHSLARTEAIATMVLCVDSFTYEVAIVTGGSCGAGREIARTLASRGYAVVVVYLRDQGAAEAAIDEILAAGGTALAVRADVADELDVERLFDETKAAFGDVDVVVHAAPRASSVVNQRAARELRHGGAILNVSSSDPITPVLADELGARDITINGLAPGLETPGAHHEIADLLALLDRWRGTPWD